MSDSEFNDNNEEDIDDAFEDTAEPKVGSRNSISCRRGCQRCQWRGTLVGSEIGMKIQTSIDRLDILLVRYVIFRLIEI